MKIVKYFLFLTKPIQKIISLKLKEFYHRKFQEVLMVFNMEF